MLYEFSKFQKSLIAEKLVSRVLQHWPQFLLQILESFPVALFATHIYIAIESIGSKYERLKFIGVIVHFAFCSLWTFVKWMGFVVMFFW